MATIVSKVLLLGSFRDRDSFRIGGRFWIRRRGRLDLLVGDRLPIEEAIPFSRGDRGAFYATGSGDLADSAQ
jgi:hypothetical protein